MKKQLFILVVIIATTSLYAKLNIIVSIVPQQTFVERIGGNKVNVTTMVKPGSDPHSYEPKPSQMIAISKANIYFPIKIEFENAWLQRFKEQNSKMEFIQMTKGIEFIDMPKHGNLEATKAEKKLPYKWAGLFKLLKGEYTWSFDKVNGKYADSKMRFLMIKAQMKSENLIESYKE
ncbi:MAG: ABC-type Zn uptake system ZnuABC Zn-binding protein ZnuA, partial [Sulfurimonas sp.]|uniref:metal ABC transporter solute-binding protein, Zn/Mn family n=1 Tax=Sulfurimonas sp. TaxID=2022749 RepID=UPI0039E24D20